jgi:site-specific DNA-cytosine methylase
MTMIKILLGGSPCTYWSICRAGNTQTDITRETAAEGIGWELFKNYLIAKEKLKPDVFIYENVSSMSKDIKKQITVNIEVEPTEINGALFSAAERARLFWTNIQLKELPLDKGLVLKDILAPEEQVEQKYYYDCGYTFHGWDKAVCATLHINGNDILKRISNPAFKCPTLTTCGGGNTQKKVLVNGRARKLTPTEYERCMTLPDGYTKVVSDSQRYNGLGNGWCADAVIWQLEQGLKYVPLDQEIIVVSMYDGIGTGRYCLDKMGYTNVKYFAYEIDKHAMQIALSNYPDIIQCGDAFQVREDGWGNEV